MKYALKYVLLFLTTAFLCACATTVEVQNVEIKELEKLDSDYEYVSGKSGWTPEGELSGQAISKVNMLENKSFLEISFSSPSDLEAMATELRGGGLSYLITPCDKTAKPNDSRYNGGVMVLTQATSNLKKYFVFIPKSLRKAMHSQSRISVTAYEKYMKNAITSDMPKDLCLNIGAIEYYSVKKFNGRIGSLEELGITLD